MHPVQEDMKLLMQTRYRWASDDQIRKQTLMDAFEKT